jgi:glycosyltransferase involved in cell wall biosynthesis
MSVPDVTIIIPCRNYGRFLKAAIDSVLSQSAQSFEILLFNDDSTDDTDAVAKAYMGDPRISYVRQPRRGLSATRNAGLRRARGRYIQFLDADDLLDQGKLHLQVGLMESNLTLAATYCPYRAIDQHGAEIDDPIRWRPISSSAPLEDLLFSWDRDLHVPPVCFLFRRELLAVIQFDEALPTHEEWDFYLQLAFRSAPFHASSEPMASYRRHAGSLSTDSHRMEIGRRLVLQKVVQRGGRTGLWAEQCLTQDASSANCPQHQP